TDEPKDRTGMTWCLVALEWTVMIERRAGGVSVRAPCWDVVIVQHPPLIDQARRQGCQRRQLREQLGDDVSPGFLSVAQMQGFDRLFGSLVGRKARPIVPAGRARRLGL